MPCASTHGRFLVRAFHVRRHIAAVLADDGQSGCDLVFFKPKPSSVEDLLSSALKSGFCATRRAAGGEAIVGQLENDEWHALEAPDGGVDSPSSREMMASTVEVLTIAIFLLARSLSELALLFSGRATS